MTCRFYATALIALCGTSMMFAANALVAPQTTVHKSSSFSSGQAATFGTSRINGSSMPQRLVSYKQQHHHQKASNTLLFMGMSSSNEESTETTKTNNLPMLLDVGTKGGALFLSLVLFLIPIGLYQVVINAFGVDPVDAGKWIGVGFTAISTVAWVASYMFRVATKDMTYAKQLKDYENAVIAKRLEELDEDEVQALVEDIERDDF